MFKMFSATFLKVLFRLCFCIWPRAEKKEMFDSHQLLQKLPGIWLAVVYFLVSVVAITSSSLDSRLPNNTKQTLWNLKTLLRLKMFLYTFIAYTILRTCWIYNLCGSIKIKFPALIRSTDQFWSIKAYADPCGSMRTYAGSRLIWFL